MAGVNIAIPNLAEDLNASAKMIAWMPTLYLLSSVMFMLPCGKIADNYGRKRVYASGLALNALASLMCALATSIEWVLFWRFIQGAAGAMIFGIGVAIITSVTPDNKRGMALGTSAACVYIGLLPQQWVVGLLKCGDGAPCFTRRSHWYLCCSLPLNCFYRVSGKTIKNHRLTGGAPLSSRFSHCA